MNKHCATYGHYFSGWINYPITPPFTITPIPPDDAVPPFERIRYVSKRTCQRCGYVQKDTSNA